MGSENGRNRWDEGRIEEGDPRIWRRAAAAAAAWSSNGFGLEEGRRVWMGGRREEEGRWGSIVEGEVERFWLHVVVAADDEGDAGDNGRRIE